MASGIFLSRIAGLIREKVFAFYMGDSGPADAFRAAVKIPNLIQNLLGEGALSASFIPVYARQLADGDRQSANRTAGAVFGLLGLAVSVLTIVGVALADPLTSLLAPGFNDARHDLTVEMVRIMMPGTAVLVLSAWCLGVLNSHRRFFLPYAAPVIWNVIQIVAMVAAGVAGWALGDIARGLAWAVLVGGVAQFLIQLPAVRSVAPALRPNLDVGFAPVRDVLGRFVPALAGRGITQISNFVDLTLVSLVSTGAVAAIGYGQILFTLPLALFAMSVVASSLPGMSAVVDDLDDVARRVDRAQRRIAFFIVFSAVAFVAAGDAIVGALLEGGEFSSDAGIRVWFIVGAYAIGLPANASSRLLQSASYALGDTKGPARIALVRVTFDAVFTLLLIFRFDQVVVDQGHLLGLGEVPGLFGRLPESVREQEGVVRLGAVGSALGSALAAWIELALLRRKLAVRLPNLPSPYAALARLGVAAALAFVTMAAVKLAVIGLPALLVAPVVVGVGGAVYVVSAFRTGVTEAHLVLRPVRRLIWR